MFILFIIMSAYENFDILRKDRKVFDNILYGGNKRVQSRDIKKAKDMWYRWGKENE